MDNINNHKINKRILAIDVGMGTQDILIYDPSIPVENCIKMVLPSQTRIIAGKIAKATKMQKDIVLTGVTMGGGPSSNAVKRHLASGLSVYSTMNAAMTLHDDIRKIEEMGVIIIDADDVAKYVKKDSSPEIIVMQDVDRDALKKALGMFGVVLPSSYAVAVQDHGFSPDISNRVFRFDYFKKLLNMGGTLDSFAYTGGNIPEHLTRMRSVEKTLGKEILFMDTGPAAICGALLDDGARQPALVINIGNGHTIAAVVESGRIVALFEHHTFQMRPGKIEDYCIRMCNGKLDFDEVFNDGGHGCHINEVIGFSDIKSILVTGPNRALLRNSRLKAHFASPFGDMMLTGCFGLVNMFISKIKQKI